MPHNAVWLGKKSRLSGPILRVAKLPHADANQAKPLARSLGHVTAHRAPALPGDITHQLIVEGTGVFGSIIKSLQSENKYVASTCSSGVLGLEATIE